ncbi:MAG: MerR family transcriptional regulator [Cyanobacteria bacterium RYN_339]|nr:MerR family transcriptional regulator [Cyanobacteria bacterium RYN_339]
MWKIGDLARRTQLTVRTLRHYDQIGLLSPSERTDGGHRLYTEADVARLQRILSLRQLGFSLDEVQACLDRSDFALGPLVALHIERLEAQITLQQQLVKRLTALDERLKDKGRVSVTQLFETMEAITMLDKYLSPEMIQKLVDSRGADPDRAEFKAMIEKLRATMQAGEAPDGPAAQALAKAWIARSKETIGNDPELGAGLQRMLASEPEVRQRMGLDEALWDYMQETFKE